MGTFNLETHPSVLGNFLILFIQVFSFFFGMANIYQAPLKTDVSKEGQNPCPQVVYTV